MHCNMRSPEPHQSFSALITTPCQIWSRWTYHYRIIAFFAADTLRYAVTLTFDPLTLKGRGTSRVTWSKSVRNLSEIEQSPAELLIILGILHTLCHAVTLAFDLIFLTWTFIALRVSCQGHSDTRPNGWAKWHRGSFVPAIVFNWEMYFVAVQHTPLAISLSAWRMSPPAPRHLHCGTTTCVVSIRAPCRAVLRSICSVAATWRLTDILFCTLRSTVQTSASWRSSWAVSSVPPVKLLQPIRQNEQNLSKHIFTPVARLFKDGFVCEDRRAEYNYRGPNGRCGVRFWGGGSMPYSWN